MIDRVAMVKAKDTGAWQGYKFTNPVSKKIEPEVMYCERLGELAKTMQALVARNEALHTERADAADARSLRTTLLLGTLMLLATAGALFMAWRLQSRVVADLGRAQGRGVTVVASEVRSLAQRSAEAAREIKTLIGASVEKVDSGTRLVADAGSTMNEIVASVQRVSDIIGEISAATGEQSSGIGLVNTAVADLDRMTQQNAALVEQSAAAAESLKDQASRLTQVVGGFQLGAAVSTYAPATRGHASSPARAAPAPTVPTLAAAARQVVARAKSAPVTAVKPAAPAKPAPAAPKAAAPAAPVNRTPAPAPVKAGGDDDWESF